MSKHIRKVLGLLQHRKQIPPPHQQPTSRTPEEWSTYWKAQGQPWRTEPEIDKKRQEYLAKRRLITPNIEQGIYPFKDIRLSRADVEWLLATHEKVKGSVNRGVESQREHEGLDLRDADLHQVDLSHLPLTRPRQGFGIVDWRAPTEAQLEGHFLVGPPLKEAYIVAAQLEGANLGQAQLKGTYLNGAQLKRANLSEAQLKRANLSGAQLEEAELSWAQLEEADLGRAQLKKAKLFGAQLKRANLSGAQLEEAELYDAQLEGAILSRAQLKGAILAGANLEGADLSGANLEEADLSGANLEKAKIQHIILSNKQRVSPLLADVQWGNINLAVVNWSQILILGDEYLAEQRYTTDGKYKNKGTRLSEYQAAVRANRQLAVSLREQGLNEEADHFAYRAQKLQRIVLRRQRKFGRYLFLGFLDLIAGYGYRPGRSVFWYLVIVCGFALAYHLLGQLSLFPPDAFVYSLTSFHGRGFFPGLEVKHSLHDPLIMLAALEAVVGLFIEISFIATFTQRFFGK